MNWYRKRFILTSLNDGELYMSLQKVLKLSVISLVVVGCATKSPQIDPQAKGSLSPQAAQKAQITPQEMQKKFEEYSKVNEQHNYLKQFEGNWSYNSSWWLNPGTKPEVSKGSSQNQIVMGGRFLEQRTKGQAMGQSFEGRAITGFDNVKKEYTSIWFDSMGTGMAISHGKQAGSAIKEDGSASCPIENGPKSYRTVLTPKDKNHYTFEMYTSDSNGNEFKNMEIAYTRR